MKSFAELFKKYRLRAEFNTFSAFSDALSEKGYFYEESIFSHWQKGTRLPTSRDVVLKIIVIFNERRAIQTLYEANEFLEAAQHGYLTEREKEEFHFAKDYSSPFQVPSEIANFIGREKILEKIKKEITAGEILLLHGAPGVGKTALAIRLGHILRHKYPDGVLWYKVDSSNVMDILLSIARLFGEDIGIIKDVEVRASIVRTLLSDKKLLLIFDNVTDKHVLKLLIPNSPTSSIIFTSQENSLAISNPYIPISVSTFTHEETYELFKNIFNKNFITKNGKQINELSEKLGYLPLALQMAANYIKQSNVELQDYIVQLNNESIDLQQMKYEDKSLFRAISISFNTLDSDTKSLFVTIGIFEGKDFSLEAISFINKISESKTKQRLQKLMDISFVEESNNKRYRIHPLIKVFARKYLTDPSYYLRAAQYYEQLLARADEQPCMKVLRLEIDNILYVFKQCYEKGYWDQIIILWNPLEKFLSDVNEIKKLRLLAEQIDTSPSINILQKLLALYVVFLIVCWILLYLSGTRISFMNYFYGFLFNMISVIGGLVGILRSKSWGLFNSNMGKAILFISAGLFSWGLGGVIWTYYNIFVKIDLPYPSYADIAYTPAYCFWLAGILFLSRATGTKFTLRIKQNKRVYLLIPFLIVSFSYYFLLFVAKPSFSMEYPVKVFLDLYYPTMDILILTMATIILGLSANFFRGKYKLSVFAVLGGFALQYIGDFLVSYSTSANLYYNGYVGDLIFTLASFLLTWGTLSFYVTPRNKEVTAISKS